MKCNVKMKDYFVSVKKPLIENISPLSVYPCRRNKNESAMYGLCIKESRPTVTSDYEGKYFKMVQFCAQHKIQDL